MKSLEKRVAELERIIRGPSLTRHTTPIACRIYDDAAQTLTTGVVTAINFAHEYNDEFGMHDTVTNNSRVYFPAAGWYLLDTQIAFAVNAVGNRLVGFRLDGSTYVGAEDHKGDATRVVNVSVARICYITSGQYLEVVGRQDSAGDLATYINNPQAPLLAVYRLG